jgi:hypothetical protein
MGSSYGHAWRITDNPFVASADTGQVMLPDE